MGEHYWVDGVFELTVTFHFSLPWIGGDTLMLLVGTKQDLVSEYPELREVELSEAQSLANSKYMIGALETSAKADKNIERTFVKLAKSMIKRHEGFSPSLDQEDSIHLTTRKVDDKESHWQCAC